MKLKPEIKERWITALRSGNYDQGYGFLRDATDRFCCLGVLCDLYSAEMHEEWTAGFPGNAYSFASITTIPAMRVESWAAESYDGLTDFGDLADLNDGRWSFAEIANVIEKEM